MHAKNMSPPSVKKLFKEVFFKVYKEVNVFVNEQSFTENNVFICQSQLNPNGIVTSEAGYIDYFISEEYNMNDASDSSTNYIAGRFLFLKPRADQRGPSDGLKLVGIVEEPAIALCKSVSNEKASTEKTSTFCTEFAKMASSTEQSLTDIEFLYLNRRGDNALGKSLCDFISVADSGEGDIGYKSPLQINQKNLIFFLACHN